MLSSKLLQLLLLINQMSKVGVPISLSSRVGYFAILFALQLAFYKLFCTFFADIIRERENLVLGALTGALFTIFNPYTFNALVGGQPEYLRALAAFLFFSHSVYKLFFLNSKKRVLHIIVCVLSTTFFMGTNYFLSAFYLFICLIIMVIILTKCRGQYPLLFSLLLLIVLVNVWWAIPLLLVNLNSQVIATGMKQIDPDKALQSSSALDFFINLRIHYGRLGQMYPAQPHLNDFFLTFFNKLCGFLLLAFSLSCFFLYRSKTIFYLVVAATLFSFLQMGGAAVSFSLLWETIPFFKIFRQPYKFTMVLFIFQAALLGLFSAWILSKTWKRVYKLSLAIGLCCIIFLNMLPMLAGNLGGILTPLVIPQDYWEFKTKVDYTDESYRILALPQTRGVLKYSWADENTGVSFLDRFFRHPLLEIKVKTIFNNYSKRLLEDNLDSKNAVAAWKLLGVKYVLDRHDVSRNRKEISQIPFSSHQAVFQKQELVPFMSTKNLSIYKLDGSYPLVFSPKSLKLKSKPVPLSEMDEKQLWLPQQFLLSAFDRTEIDRGLYAFSWVDRHSDFLKYAIQEANEIKESEDYLNLSVKDITLDSPPQIEFQRCSSTRFIVRISNVKHGFPLVLNESYDRGWSVFYILSPTVKSSPDIVKKYRPGIVEIKEYPQPSPFFSLFEKPLFKASHTLGNGFANMWWITPDKLPRTENGDLLLMIEYNAQPFVYLSLVVSSLTVISLFSWFLFSFSTRSIRVTMLCLIAILVFPTTSVSASEDEIDFFFVHNERGIKSVFYGNVQSSYKTDSPTTIKIRAIARPTHTYYKVKQQDLPLSWNEHICETPPCSQEIVLDFRDSPIKLNLTQKIILTGQKENRQGRMGVIGRAIIADTAHLEASPREIHFFTTLNDSTPIERYTAEDFSIIPKDISYLIKRELGLSNNKLWRSSQDQDRLVLQTRTNVLLTDDTIFKLTIKERYMPESIQFSIGRLGLGGRQAFILDSQTRKSSRRIGNGYVEVKVDFNGVLNRLGFDPEQAFILEPILFLPMDEKTFKRVAPIKEVAFLRGHPAASLSRLNNQEVQLEVFLNQLEEDLPPSTVLQQLNLNIQLYNYDQFVATKLGLVTHEELFQPSIFLAGEKALSSWGIKEKTEGGRRSFRPALFPLFKQNEYAQTPFNDKDIAISGTTPYKLTKGDSQIKLTGVFPDSDSLLNLTILPQKQPRFLRFSLKSASMKRLSMKNQHGGILFTTQGIKLPTEQALNFTIVPPHSNKIGRAHV